MLFDPKNDCMRGVVILFYFTFEETEFPEKQTYSNGHICGKWWKQTEIQICLPSESVLKG